LIDRLAISLCAFALTLVDDLPGIQGNPGGTQHFENRLLQISRRHLGKAIVPGEIPATYSGV
jgi:hypothetical protein